MSGGVQPVNLSGISGPESHPGFLGKYRFQNFAWSKSEIVTPPWRRTVPVWENPIWRDLISNSHYGDQSYYGLTYVLNVH